MTLDKKELGAAIKAARIDNKFTQEQLAEIIGVAPSHIKQMESGSRCPSVEVLYKLAKTLNLSIDAIFFPKNNESYLIDKIELCLRECSTYELNVINSTIAALKNTPKD